MSSLEPAHGLRLRRRRITYGSSASSTSSSSSSSSSSMISETESSMSHTIEQHQQVSISSARDMPFQLQSSSSSSSTQRRRMSNNANANRSMLILSCCSVLVGGLLSCSAFHLPFSSSVSRNHHHQRNSNSNSVRRIGGGLDPTMQRSQLSFTTKSRIAMTKLSLSTGNEQQQQQQQQRKSSQKKRAPNGSNNSNNKTSGDNQKKSYNKKNRKYSRKLPLSPSEKAAIVSRKRRRLAYEEMRSKSLEKTNEPPSIWRFDSLFRSPVLDEKSIREDLYGNKKREKEMKERRQVEDEQGRMRKQLEELEKQEVATAKKEEKDMDVIDRQAIMETAKETAAATDIKQLSIDGTKPQSVDTALTRMVTDRIYGLSRTPAGSIQYSTSMLDSSRAVQFREGVRLGKALTINVDRLCHFAKKDVSQRRLEEAQESYLKAMQIDPTDGRPYLGLSRIAQRRGDLEQARKLLKEGIKQSTGGHVVVKGPGTVAVVESKKKKKKKYKYGMKPLDRDSDGFQGNDDTSGIDFEEEEGATIGTITDLGPNPFLLQALGTLEEKLGNLAAAEELYLQAIRSRPSHAAAWVSLAQLRTRKLRQGAAAGRACYQSAERELLRIGAKPNAFVYTAWASMEYKKGIGGDDYLDMSLRKARELYQKALGADPKCSVAFLQLGVMESECGNYDEAQDHFETVLKFDQRNSRVLQAYAIMESRRSPDASNSRKVLDLFERALKANPRDAGVYQAYGLYVVELGDIDSARDLLRKGTEVNKRHAPAWQAWGVLETRYSTAKSARDVFQQGIWACAQPGGGQSGGRRCARLWQAWGVLESREGDHAAARRCFSRALDADVRNVAAVTAWTSMEAELGNFADARSIFERSLKLFRSSSVDKTAVWRAYEIIEERAGNTREAQAVFQRSMRESMAASMGEDEDSEMSQSELLSSTTGTPKSKKSSKKNREVDDSRWDTGSNGLDDGEVWINNGSIEGKVPPSMMKKLKNRR